MDKIREEFEKWLYKYFEGWAKLQKTENGDYQDNQIHDLWQAYKSRDEEIKKLREALQELVDECNDLICDEDIFCIERAEEVLKEIT